MKSDEQDDKNLIDELVNDRKKFDEYVYFASMEEALQELERRRQDPLLAQKVEEYLKDVGIPEPFVGDPRLVIFRQVATPNIEVSRFLIIADGVGMKPLFLEYYDDKFTSNNEWKWFLGKLGFYEGVGKKGGEKISYKLIIDFVASDGKKLKDVKTFWGESLIDFHHRLFDFNYTHIDKDYFFDITPWLEKGIGFSAVQYYKKVFPLFIKNAILFENFMLCSEEKKFTSEIFLPVFKNLFDYFGVKPIIVALSPTNIESDAFWFCQNPVTKTHIDDIIKKYDKLD